MTLYAFDQECFFNNSCAALGTKSSLNQQFLGSHIHSLVISESVVVALDVLESNADAWIKKIVLLVIEL